MVCDHRHCAESIDLTEDRQGFGLRTSCEFISRETITLIERPRAWPA
jgi:hypothetical protein